MEQQKPLWRCSIGSCPDFSCRTLSKIPPIGLIIVRPSRNQRETVRPQLTPNPAHRQAKARRNQSIAFKRLQIPLTRALISADRSSSPSDGSSHACSEPQAGGGQLNAPNLRPSPHAKQRRSQRILLSIPVIVSGQPSSGAPFAERTGTLIVNARER